MLRSFRQRLIIAFVALFAAISVAVSFVILLVREQQISNLFNAELMTRAEGLAESINKLPVIDDASLATVIDDVTNMVYFRGFYVQIYDDQSEPLARSKNLGNHVLPLARPVKDRSKDGVIVEGTQAMDLAAGKAPMWMRGIRLRFVRPDAREYIAIIATDPSFIYASINSLRWLFLIGNVAGSVAAGGAAWFVTGAMSRRLAMIKDQLISIGPENIQRRLIMRDKDEISDLAHHLNQMLERLQAGFETQERFIHDASHELKTPLATVQAEAQALLIGESTREELADFARAAADEMKRLARLTEALLVLTRPNEQSIIARFKPAEIAEMATAAMLHLSSMAADHAVQLKLHDQRDPALILQLRCDAELIEAMISNLVRNALRFSPRGGTVDITITADNTSLIVHVDDQGPGIPDDLLPYIFDRYFHTSQARVRRGAGLGLAIAFSVARIHGGVVNAHNLPDKGARFTVRLPLTNK